MKDTLVVFYSRSGNTRRVAQRLARMLDADLEEISERRSRVGLFGFVRSMLDVMRTRLPAIEATPLDGDRYQTVVIGSPVWAGHVSGPVRSYIVQNAGAIHQLGLFCTMKSTGGTEVLAEMAALRTPDLETVEAGHFPTLALRDDEINRGDDARLIDFVNALRGGKKPRKRAATKKRRTSR